MKWSSVWVCLLMAGQCAWSQSVSSNQLKEVKVDWSRMSVMLTDQFWSDTKEELVKQLGGEKFEEIKERTVTMYNKKVPGSLKIWDGHADHPKLTAAEYYQRLGSLKVYEVASCRQFYEGQEFKYTILELPYQPLVFDPNASKWERFYFVVLSDAVREK